MIDPAADPKARARALFNLVAPEYDTVGPRAFAHYGRRLVEIAGVQPGHRVLDVATGRGAVLIPAAERAAPDGEAIGVDLAESMAAATGADVAARGLPARTLVMDAETLDFPDGHFDRVFCGFGIMFMPDRPAAVAGFRRVLRDGGRLGMSTWRDSNAEELHVVMEQVGIPAPRQPGWLTDPEHLDTLLRDAGFASVDVRIEPHVLRYADADEYLATARTTGVRRLLDGLDAPTLERLRAALTEHLESFRGAESLEIRVSALIGVADR